MKEKEQEMPILPANEGEISEPPKRIFLLLADLRKKINMTQAEVAEQLGIHQSYLSLIERGKRRPSPKLLQAIAALFGLSVSKLNLEPWTVEMAKQMIAEDVASMYYSQGELSLSKGDRNFLLSVIHTLMPQVLVKETSVS